LGIAPEADTGGSSGEDQSPGLSVVNSEMTLMSVATSKIIWSVDAYWTTCPFTVVRRVSPVGLPNSSELTIHGPTGVAPSPR
jgi:hypothetical protein